WMTDFGNNRIVQYFPGDNKETAWTFFDPGFGRLNPSQIRFDSFGSLWISQFSGGAMDRFFPSTGELASYSGFLGPLHFDLFNRRAYGAETASVNGTIVVLDPKFAVGTGVQLTSHQNLVVGLPNQLATKIRDTTITPTTFTTTQAPIAATNLTVTTG